MKSQSITRFICHCMNLYQDLFINTGARKVSCLRSESTTYEIGVMRKGCGSGLVYAGTNQLSGLCEH
jgi:hypothetical protein